MAYALRRAELTVTLVERGVVGRETSWTAAGYLSFQGDSNQSGPRLELMRTSRLLYDGWLEALAEFSAADTGFWRCGLLEICLSDEEVRAAQERLAWQRAAGYAIEWLDAATVRARQPHLAPDLPVHGGLWLPEVAQVRCGRRTSHQPGRLVTQVPSSATTAGGSTTWVYKAGKSAVWSRRIR